MIRETGSENTNSYVWGLDLSGTLQGAGGIGGLVSVVKGTNAYSVACDANGNVAAYVAPDGTAVARYQYNPYGNVLSTSGTLTEAFAYRFSTKYSDDESGLLYYGFRYYSPGMGRWINRDPVGEIGGSSLYVVLFNNCVSQVDILGLLSLDEAREYCQLLAKTWRDYGPFKEYLDVMEDTDCGFPKIQCKCCEGSTDDIGGSQTGRVIKMCYRSGSASLPDQLNALKHELQHYIDRNCLHKPFDCGANLDNVICSEIRAYSRTYNDRTRILAMTVDSTMKVCKHLNRNDVIRRAVALYSRCHGSPIGVFPP